MRIFKLFSIVLFFVITSCGTKGTKTIGSIERIDAELDAIIDNNAKIEIITP